jgi:CRISPR-associated endonuclease/helicase Cas3
MSAGSNPESTRVYYAHTAQDKDWERLEDHLRRVADGVDHFSGASGFASAFGAGELGRALGFWHDLGKYSDRFQTYLRAGDREDGPDGHRAETRGTVDHSTAGAQHAATRGHVGRLLAYCIAGHHGGLPDNVPEAGESGLRTRLLKAVDPWNAAAPTELLDPPLPPPRLKGKPTPFALGFLARMLFSSLVDADFLATEAFMNSARATNRPRDLATPAALLTRLDAHLADLEHKADRTVVNACRSRVLRACRDKAALPPGLFSLNVPTGGGKTFASLAFALAHAAAHGHRRVVYAIPFTSIIEQTADNFREALGDLAGELLEHHSNIDPADETKLSDRSRLAAENFDAPLIVTTNVQLFESMFASKTSRCRKLHRLARSVIVLDEAQALPPQLLEPTLAAIKELVTNYGCSVVLCTATQPAIERRDAFPIGLEGVRPIMGDPAGMHAELRRTSVESVGALTNEEIAERLHGEPRVLCIVNSRRHAAEIFALLRQRGDDPLHLSAQMCPAHRTDVLARVRRALQPPGGTGPCRVISTQVVEAGVDLDFPVVYRAAAGLDSIAQAAGRCNREGKLDVGRVVVFDYDEGANRPPPLVRTAAGHFREIAPDHLGDLLAPAAIEEYFRLHYWKQGGECGAGWDRGRDGKSVMKCFGGEGRDDLLHHQFRQAAERYRLIDDAQTPVLVPYDERALRLREELLALPEFAPDLAKRLRDYDRAAQRYTVGVYEHALRKLLDNAVLLERHGRYALGRDKSYDWDLGLTPEGSGLDPEGLMP